MAHIEEVIQPKVWMNVEAFSSGQTAYRIGVELNGNPFSKHPLLSEQWVKGYNEASAKDPYKRRIDYSVSEDRHDRRPKSRAYTNVWRPGRTPKEDIRHHRD